MRVMLLLVLVLAPGPQVLVPSQPSLRRGGPDGPSSPRHPSPSTTLSQLPMGAQGPQAALGHGPVEHPSPWRLYSGGIQMAAAQEPITSGQTGYPELDEGPIPPTSAYITGPINSVAETINDAVSPVTDPINRFVESVEDVMKW